MKNFFRVLGVLLAPVLASLGIQAVIGAIGGLSYSILFGLKLGFEMARRGIENPGDILAEISTDMILPPDLIYIISVIAIVISGVVFFFWYRHAMGKQAKVKISSVLNGKTVGLLLLLGLGCQFLVSGILGLMEPYFKDLFSDYENILENLLGGHFVLVLLLTIVIAPIVEELIFRGLTLQKSSRLIPFVAANLIQAALFGLYHGNIVQGVYAFALGILLGYIMLRFKTILAPILLHMAVNASSFLMAFVPYDTIVLVMISILGAVMIVMIYLQMKNTVTPVMILQQSDESQRQDHSLI